MELSDAGFQALDPAETAGAAAANARWWTTASRDYLAEHGADLGDAELTWGPEGWRESELGLLGDLDALRAARDGAGARVLEVGAGAAQGSRWLRAQGVDAIASDVSPGMLARAAELDTATGIAVPAVLADARDLPFPDASFDVVFTAYGALPFVPDAGRVHAQAARVLRPGGRWVCAVTHPVRWAFPDDPGAAGLTATRSYFDRAPYVERDAHGQVAYAEFHRTLGDHVRDVAAAGLRLVDLVEPQWPERRTGTWGGWSALRGQLLPGTAIFVALKDAPGRDGAPPR